MQQPELQVHTVATDSLVPYANNSKLHDEAQVATIVASMQEFGNCDPIAVWHNAEGQPEIVEGHGRLLALRELGIEEAPVIYLDHLTDEQRRAYSHVHNQTTLNSGMDPDVLETELDELDFDWSSFGFDLDDTALTETEERASLTDEFLVPPFSVFDTRQGYWIERRRLWESKIGDLGQARKDSAGMMPATKYDYITGVDTDVSILDATLAEVLVTFFCPKGGLVVDPFAGDTSMGFVSGYTGHPFIGIELRKEQCTFNQSKVDVYDLPTTYICDDGRNILRHVQKGSADLLFSCPPYFNFEVYSDLENDASNQETYEEFYAIVDTALFDAAAALKDNRFAAIVCSDIRDKSTGAYLPFQQDIIRTFERAGMSLYNSAVLINSAITAPIRARNNMRTRKLVRCHQNVLLFYKGDTRYRLLPCHENILVFYKGDPGAIRGEFGEIEVMEEDASEDIQLERLGR